MTHSDDQTNEIVYFSAEKLVDLYKDHSLSPVEVITAIIDRVNKLDKHTNAFCFLDADSAKQAAQASEKRWHEGKPLSPLDGVPVSIKDLLLTKEWPTLRGSHLSDPNPASGWDEDAPAVARLREGGTIIFGKTTTPELGWKGVTDNPLTGITRNPWNLEKTPGGSSGGSAAAVAWGMGPLSVGTDGGGSVRIPAGFSGIFGLKPTYGRIPLYPSSPFGTLAHAGPMTRTAADAAYMMDLLTGFDSRDWSAMPTPHLSHTLNLRNSIKGMKIAMSTTMGYITGLHPEIKAAVINAGKLFEELGAEVHEVDPPITSDPEKAFHVLWFSGAAKAVELLHPKDRSVIDPGLQAICEQGQTYSASDYLDATGVRMALGKAMGAFHEQYDLLLTPTLPISAFTAGKEVPEGSSSDRWTSWTPYTYPFNMTQQPAASIPFGLTSENLPIGIQLVAARHNDALILQAAHALEQHRSAMPHPPER